MKPSGFCWLFIICETVDFKVNYLIRIVEIKRSIGSVRHYSLRSVSTNGKSREYRDCRMGSY